MEGAGEFTVEETVFLTRQWMTNAPRGIGLASCLPSEIRFELLEALTKEFRQDGVPLNVTDLSTASTPQEIVSRMVAATEEYKFNVFHGFERPGGLAEIFYILNVNREQFTKHGGLQLWVVSPRFRVGLIQNAYDLFSWFLPQFRVGPQCQPEELPNTKSTEDLTPKGCSSSRRRLEDSTRRVELGLLREDLGDVWPMVESLLHDLVRSAQSDLNAVLLDRIRRAIAKRFSLGDGDWEHAPESQPSFVGTPEVAQAIGNHALAESHLRRALSLIEQGVTKSHVA